MMVKNAKRREVLLESGGSHSTGEQPLRWSPRAELSWITEGRNQQVLSIWVQGTWAAAAPVTDSSPRDAMGHSCLLYRAAQAWSRGIRPQGAGAGILRKPACKYI